MTRWSAAQIDTLKRWRVAGVSYGRCARKLRRTRNSVIGKARRAGLHPPMEPREIATTNEWMMRQAWAASRRETPPPPPAEGHNVLAFARSPQRAPVRLADLSSAACKWPIGDTRDRDFGYCGWAALKGSPYCAEHRAIAYEPRTKAA